MKRLFYQIKYSSFCRKIEREIKLLDRIEKNAIKEAQETSRISYQNYLKLKEKGLLSKEYFEQEYKNLEDVITNKIQLSSKRRTEILKNLTEENFKNLKINPLIIEDLRKYVNSNDNSPFKAKLIPNNNINSTNGSGEVMSANVKISNFLNQNFSVQKTDSNKTKQISEVDLNDNTSKDIDFYKRDSTII